MPVPTGTFFQLFDSTTGEWSHPWFVISPPIGDDGDALCVNVTTDDPFGDQSCLILPGEHPKITAASVVAYGFAKLLPTEKLAGAPDSLVIKGPPANGALLKRMQDGGRNSPHLRPRFKSILELEP